MQSKGLWFLYSVIAMAKGSEVGGRSASLTALWAPCPALSKNAVGRIWCMVWEGDKEKGKECFLGGN